MLDKSARLASRCGIFEERVKVARGNPGNPMRREELEEKFRGLAGSVLALALRRSPLTNGSGVEWPLLSGL